MSSPDPDDTRDVRLGTAYGAGAFLLWGIFPLYFHALIPAGAIEIVVHRVVWSLLVCLVILAVTRQVGWVRAMLRNPRQVAWLALAASCIAVNWGVYVYGVNSGQAVEAALGYFINPLVTVLLGVVVLRERLRGLQWAAVGLGAVAVVVLTAGYGHPPWIALALAFSFATYGLLKKRVGVNVGAVASLTTETAVLFPLAAAAMVWLEVTGRGTFTEQAPGHWLLLASTGIVTVVPLLLFASGARRVPLVTMGLLQFITPVLQLICGVLVLDETVPPSRWVGFGIVWAALVVLTVDAVRQSRRASARKASATPIMMRA
ncbi:EamA family transporter RarD [Angustibacter luteus]|uniref:EamA family transporter RarD n=1 Tax=Angustibacter luteus TaxID=658456 RepID=A0ABW1JFL5_9ACTN